MGCDERFFQGTFNVSFPRNPACEKRVRRRVNMHACTALDDHGQREGIEGCLFQMKVLVNDTAREDRDVKVLRCEA